MVEIPARFILYRHYTSVGREYHRRLSADGGRTLAWSTVGHLEKTDCENDIKLVREPYPGSAVRNLTLAPL